MIATARYRIRHLTEYAYLSDVVHSHQLLHLVPRPIEYQECIEHSIEICLPPRLNYDAGFGIRLPSST